MKKILLTVALGLSLPLSAAQAGQNLNAQNALNSLNASVASAELSIALANANDAISDVRGQDAVNQLSASVANAEVSISLANAYDAIALGERHEAMNMLTASIASAEMSIALANGNETLSGVSDETMLSELSGLLADTQTQNADQLILATVSERPVLASTVQAMALESGLGEAMVASAIIGGLSAAEATAAGQ